MLNRINQLFQDSPKNLLSIYFCAGCPTPFLLSGGINPYSVKALREFRHPYFAGIDINSRFETAPGIKDVERISNFLKELKGGTI